MGLKPRRRVAAIDPEAVPQYLLSVELEYVRCFGPKQEIDLSNGRRRPATWTVIFGDNGVGKTTLLQSICAVASTIRTSNQVPSFIRYDWWPYRRTTRDAFMGAQVAFSSRQSAKYSVTYSPGVRGSNLEPLRTTYRRPNSLVYFGYGATRNIGGGSLQTTLDTGPDESLFSAGALLVNAGEWFVQMDFLRKARAKNRDVAAAEKIREFLKHVLLDVTEIRVSSREHRALVEFQTPYGWVPMEDLSVGYRTLISWLVDFVRRMHAAYPESRNPMKKPAIVCIDEIDLHLHPRWQRAIMQNLSEIFPKTQFIASAHSPRVVENVPENANLVLLKRQGDHVVIDPDAESEIRAF